MNKLIDTNVFIDALRNQPKAKEFLRQIAPLLCSVITAAELIQGARDKLEQKKTETLLKDLTVISLNETISDKMIELIKTYSLPFGLQIPDAFIAATAIEENLTLVTSNTKHFSFIKGLRLKEWD